MFPHRQSLHPTLKILVFPLAFLFGRKQNAEQGKINVWHNTTDGAEIDGGQLKTREVTGEGKEQRKEREDREVRKGTRPTMAQHQAVTIRTATGSQQTMCWGLHLWRLHLFIYLFIVDEASFICKNVDLSLKYETRYHKFSESCFR